MYGAAVHDERGEAEFRWVLPAWRTVGVWGRDLGLTDWVMQTNAYGKF
jgi:hypothetical protein